MECERGRPWMYAFPIDYRQQTWGRAGWRQQTVAGAVGRPEIYCMLEYLA